MRSDYMVPHEDGDLWHFFMQEEQGLCLRKKKEGKWGEHEILLDSAVYDFALVCDNGRDIHIACQDREGSVIYLVFARNVWHKYTVLKSKTGQAYPKHFALTAHENGPILCYSLRYNNYSMIAVQSISKDIEPVVIDVVQDGKRPFCCINEGNGLRIFYTNTAGVLGCKVYQMQSGTVSKHEPIFAAGGQAFAYGDVFGRTHLAALSAEGEGIEYCRRNLDGTYAAHKTVGLGAYKPQNPIIMAESEKIWVMWESAGNIFYALSVDDAEHFSEPVRFLFNGDSRQIHMQTPAGENVCFGYVSSTGDIHLFLQSGQTNIKDAQTAKVRTQPLAAKQTESKADEPAKPAEKDSDVEAQKTQIMFTMLNSQISGLKRQVAALNKRIWELEQAQSRMESEQRRRETEEHEQRKHRSDLTDTAQKEDDAEEHSSAENEDGKNIMDDIAEESPPDSAHPPDSEDAAQEIL